MNRIGWLIIFISIRYDADHNGNIDKKEMEKIILAIYDLLGEEKRKGENDPKQSSSYI